jgi:transcriptional regulator with XRE-family HTH domain
MSFIDNLKQELSFKGILVKELATASGVRKRALDTYLLSTNASMPPADTAVKIACALGVSVEYLITGVKSKSQKNQTFLPSDIRNLVDIARA